MNIQLKNVTKKLSGVSVLDDITYEFKGNKIYGLRGKNGCGKTMLMRAISGLMQPTDGEIIINGKVLYKDITIPESIGVLIENPSFLKEYTGFRNLKLLAEIKKCIDDEQIRECLTEVGLDAYDKRTVKKYSLGMRQRLGIAAAIMEKPEIILLDEPINAIDEAGVENIRKLLVSLKDEERIIIVACHDRDELDFLADEIVCLEAGRIVGDK